MSGVITLLTDFGYKDHYVGAMKGVILNINPEVTIVDISHGISPHKVLEGAIMLSHCYAYFPHGTIHVAVVDPGVGSERKAILVAGKDYLFVGPDNGIFGLVYNQLQDFNVFQLTKSRFFLKSISNTFHGRDIFAPIAAFLSKGVSPSEIGQAIKNYTTLSIPAPSFDKNRIIGNVIYIDGFGNLITNISKLHLKGMGTHDQMRVKIGGRIINKISEHYQGVERGELLALVGSSGLLEISIREGNACKTLGVKEGDEIVIS